jgi:hypothetical protein
MVPTVSSGSFSIAEKAHHRKYMEGEDNEVPSSRIDVLLQFVKEALIRG